MSRQAPLNYSAATPKPTPAEYHSAHPAAAHVLSSLHKEAGLLLTAMNEANKQMSSDYASMARIEGLMKHAQSIGDTASETQYKKQGLAAMARYQGSIGHVNKIGNDYGEVMDMIHEYKEDAKDKRAGAIRLLDQLKLNMIQ